VCRHGTSGHDLVVDLTVLGLWLDSMNLWVIPSLNDSMILWAVTLVLPQAEEGIKPEPSASGKSYSNKWEIVQKQHIIISILKQCGFAD